MRQRPRCPLCPPRKKTKLRWIITTEIDKDRRPVKDLAVYRTFSCADHYRSVTLDTRQKLPFRTVYAYHIRTGYVIRHEPFCADPAIKEMAAASRAAAIAEGEKPRISVSFLRSANPKAAS